MWQSWIVGGVAALCFISAMPCSMALEISQEQWEKMQKKVDELEARNVQTSVTSASVDTALDSKYGPNAVATAKIGKLTIGGLVQVWYYREQTDRKGFFNDPNVNGIVDTNEVLNANGFRIRRSEIRMTMDINENIRSTLMIDPAREALGFPYLPSNQADLFGTKKGNQVSPQFLSVDKPTGVNSTAFITAGQSGLTFTGAPRLLQDACINWHGCIPHHDFQIGQFIPWIGEEGIRSNVQLDFVERSMVGFYGNTRDMGASVHGSWWECDAAQGDGRFQYWAGVFNGAGTYFEPGNQQNRPDSNNHKDINVRVLVRPLWDDCWGRLELGGSVIAGRHGEGHNDLPLTNPSVGLDRPINWAAHYNAWVCFKCRNILSGLWMRSEYTWIKDREVPGSVIDLQGNSTNTNHFAQQLGQAFSRQGVYGTVAYTFADSKICNLPFWLKPLEVLGRYDQFQNIETANLATPYKTDVFYTRVWTAGINYYIMGNAAKIQANYNFVDLPADKSNANRSFHNTRNDNFVINFQVAF